MNCSNQEINVLLVAAQAWDVFRLLISERAFNKNSLKLVGQSMEKNNNGLSAV